MATNWADDDNYSAPGKPWDGTPTKVEPTAGKQAQGHQPNERPPAQYENWWKNRTDQRLADLEASEISPAVAAQVDNWDPPGLETAKHIRVDVTAPPIQEITGIRALAAGRTIVLTAVGLLAFQLNHEDEDSDPENRFLLDGGVDLEVTANRSVHIVYDGVDQRWRVTAKNF